MNVLALAFLASGLAVPVEFDHNVIWLQARVNGSKPLWFILDSGAGICVLHAGKTRALGLRVREVGQRHNAGAGEGLAQLALANDVSFSLSGAEVFAGRVAVQDLDPLRAGYGRSLDGILGYQFLNRYVVEIDYAKETLTLHEPADYEGPAHGEALPLRLVDGTPVARARIVLPGLAPIEGEFLIDAPYAGALILNRPFVESHDLLPRAQTIIPRLVPHVSSGIGGETRGLLGRVLTLQLGRYLIQRPVASFSQAVRGAFARNDISGIIGAEVLRRFKAIFDYPHQQMILEPNMHFYEPHEYDMSGLVLAGEGEQFKEFKVRRVFPDSPAADAGVHVGDVIKAIDGRLAAHFTLWQVKQLFRQEGREYRLHVVRRGQVLEIKLRLRRLV